MVKALTNILNKPMDRKEFLAHVGMAALAVTGVSGLVKNDGRAPRVTNGYGLGAYGGAKRS